MFNERRPNRNTLYVYVIQNLWLAGSMKYTKRSPTRVLNENTQTAFLSMFASDSTASIRKNKKSVSWDGSITGIHSQGDENA